MTTPAFVPQSSSTLTPVRYHTALDPYHYTIDNRPLSDLATNLSELGVQGVDSARRAGLISSLATNYALQNLFNMEDAFQFHGLIPSYGGGSLFIGRGGIATVAPAFVGSSALAMRQGISAFPVPLVMPAPSTVGHSINYLVQIKINDLTTGIASPNPYFDSSNTYIPSSTTVGDIQFSLKAGVSAPTGTQVTPTVDAGFVALYKLSFKNGDLEPTVETVAGGVTPVRKLRYLVTYADNASGSSATATSLNGMNIPRFLNGASSSISFAVPIKSQEICTTAPIRLRMSLSGTIGGGNVKFQLDTLALGANSSVSIAPISTTELITINATADTVSTTTTSPTFADVSIKVPPSLFAGFVLGDWKMNKDLIVFQLTRLGSDVNDTASGSIDLLSLEVIQ